MHPRSAPTGIQTSAVTTTAKSRPPSRATRAGGRVGRSSLSGPTRCRRLYEAGPVRYRAGSWHRHAHRGSGPLDAREQALGVALDDAVRDQAEQATLIRGQGCPGDPPLRRLDALQGERAHALERPGRGDPVADLRRLRLIEIAQLDLSQRRVDLAGDDQRERHGPVEQISPPRLAGALRWAGDVQNVVEELERHADLAPEGRQLHVRGSPALGAPQQARALEQAGCLQRAALEVTIAA